MRAEGEMANTEERKDQENDRPKDGRSFTVLLLPVPPALLLSFLLFLFLFHLLLILCTSPLLSWTRALSRNYPTAIKFSYAEETRGPRRVDQVTYHIIDLCTNMLITIFSLIRVFFSF